MHAARAAPYAGHAFASDRVGVNVSERRRDRPAPGAPSPRCLTVVDERPGCAVETAANQLAARGLLGGMTTDVAAVGVRVVEPGEQVLAGDFAAFYREHHARCIRYCHRLVRDEQTRST